MELNRLKELITKKLNEYDYSLCSINFIKDKTGFVLSLVVDKIDPINMNDIVEISNIVNSYLDEINPIDEPYTLDISSLGAEKPLKIEELGSYIDRYIHVHLINPVLGENIYEGELKSVSENQITVSFREKTRSKTVEIEKQNISKIRLAIKF